MSTTIEAQGHTVDEAIQIALNQLGVSRDKVEIDILHHPRRGVLGIGARRAKVRATIREAVMADGEEFDMSSGASLEDKPRRRRRRGGRSRGSGDEAGGSERTGPSPRSSSNQQEAGGGADRDRRGQGRRDGEGGRGRGGDNRSRDDRRGGGRGRGSERSSAGSEGQSGRGGQPERGSGRGGRGGEQRRGSGGPREQGRGRGGRQGSQSGHQASEASAGDREVSGDNTRERSGSRGRGSRDRQSDRRSSQGEAPTSSPEGTEAQGRTSEILSSKRPPAVEEVPLDAAALEEIRGRAEGLVRELLEKMGFAAEVGSSVDEEAGEVVVAVRSESEGLLIGRRGQTLDSLEHIVNRMTLRAEAYVEGRVLLDIGDYRKRRRESLEELAGRLRERAVTERRTVQVSPMSPRDRRFFAQAFANDDAVELRSLGAGFYRRVVVAPAGGAAAEGPGEQAPREGDQTPPDSGAETTQVEAGVVGSDAES